MKCLLFNLYRALLTKKTKIYGHRLVQSANTMIIMTSNVGSQQIMDFDGDDLDKLEDKVVNGQSIRVVQKN